MPEINFFWDPLSDNILQERDETGAVTAEYTAEPGLYGNIISQNRGGVESQFHYDAQGSTLAVTDDNQNVTDTFAYTAFGEVTERTGTTEVPFQYIGQKGYYTDGLTGQIMARRRPYEPLRARWLSADPLGALSDATNYYRYVSNGPLARFDSSGLLSISYTAADLSKACGFYNVLFKYQLDETIWHLTPTGLSYIKGYIVQKVSIWHRQEPCPAVQQPLPMSLPDAPDKVFWEAWPVLTDGKSNTAKDQDYHPGGTRGEWGYRHVTGEAKFFPSHDVLHILGYPTGVTGDLTKDRDWGMNRVPEAGPALSTEIPPNWWSDRPIEGPVTRSVRVQWCCCDASRPGTFSIRPAKGEVVSDDE